jgi:hypothetical protein
LSDPAQNRYPAPEFSGSQVMIFFRRSFADIDSRLLSRMNPTQPRHSRKEASLSILPMPVARSSYGLNKISSLARGIRYQKDDSNSLSELHITRSFLTHLIFASFFPWFPGRFQETLSDVLWRPILLFHFPSGPVSGNFEKLDVFVSFIPRVFRLFSATSPYYHTLRSLPYSHSFALLLLLSPFGDILSAFLTALFQNLIAPNMTYRFKHMSLLGRKKAGGEKGQGKGSIGASRKEGTVE